MMSSRIPFISSPSARSRAGGWLFLLCFAISQINAQSYAVTDLGVLPGGTYSEALAINNAGQIVGSSSSATSGNTATTWSVGLGGGVTRTDLGTGGYRASFAQGINDSGQIVGYLTSGFDPNGTFPPPRAVLFSVNTGGVANAPQDLGALPGYSASRAYAINNAGQVVGQSLLSGSDLNGVGTLTTFAGGSLVVTRLGSATVVVPSGAYAINAAGLVAGEYQFGGASHATLFSVGAGGAVTRVDLTPANPNDGSRALGINAAGQIVGSAVISGTLRPVLFSVANGVVTQTNLGLPAGYTYGEASSINAAGQIVGTASSSTIFSRGVLFTASGGARTLDSLVLPGSGVTEISFGPMGNRLNDWGQIVGRGTVASQSHAVLLNPTTPLSSATGAAQNTRLVGGMNYAQTPAFTNPTTGSLGSTVVFRDGTAGSAGMRTFGLNRSVNVAFQATPGASPLSQLRASDVVSVQGTEGDRFVLQLSYDPALVAALSGGNQAAALLGWLDPSDGTWKAAVLGNSDQGASAAFAGDHAYNGSTDFRLGRFGVDTTNHVVWAVMDHDGAFAAVPEPSVWATTLSAAVALALVARRLARAI